MTDITERLRLLSLLSIILISGCSAGQASQNKINVCAGDGCADIILRTMPDGTRCAVLIGYKKGGISCDWDQARANARVRAIEEWNKRSGAK